MRLAGKSAIVVGAGQTPGETIGNGRAIAMLFAREGADVLCVDRLIDRAQETVALIEAEGGRASAVAANITKATDCEAMVAAARLWQACDGVATGHLKAIVEGWA